MTTYLALLRGINVGGANKMPMKALRALFEDLGHANVRTYAQSGNVIFESPTSTPSKMVAEIEGAVSQSLGVKPSVVLRNRKQLEAVGAGNPFPTEGVKPSFLHVVFLSGPPSTKALQTLDHDRSPPDEFQVIGSEIYLLLPNGAGRSKLTIDYFEKRLGTRATARNWNTVTKVLGLMEREES